MTGAVLNRQNSLSVQSRPHRRLCGFVDWIRPDPNTREVIRKQAGNRPKVMVLLSLPRLMVDRSQNIQAYADTCAAIRK
jgi:hypothetical protein